MGAYSPAPVVTQAVHDRAMNEVIWPTVRGMAAEGNVYTGFLYAGLMVQPDGTPKVLEYNCRFGDPETQPVMMRLLSDITALCDAAIDGRLDTVQAEWDARPALGVVMAAGGYPEAYAKGTVIEGLDLSDGEDCKTFHAGTALADGKVVTSGGRVLCVTALGASVAEAQARAYRRCATIAWEGGFYRRDIARSGGSAARRAESLCHGASDQASGGLKSPGKLCRQASSSMRLQMRQPASVRMNSSRNQMPENSTREPSGPSVLTPMYCMLRTVARSPCREISWFEDRCWQAVKRPSTTESQSLTSAGLPRAPSFAV
jgi:hypothetical protein